MCRICMKSRWSGRSIPVIFKAFFSSLVGCSESDLRTSQSISMMFSRKLVERTNASGTLEKEFLGPSDEKCFNWNKFGQLSEFKKCFSPEEEK